MNGSNKCEIYIHALVGLSSPETLKIVGYIKKKMVIFIMDSSRTHNFIDKILAESLNCFVYPVANFQFLVANGDNINCGGRCHNIKISMGEYKLEDVYDSHWRCRCFFVDSMVENNKYSFYKS